MFELKSVYFFIIIYALKIPKMRSIPNKFMIPKSILELWLLLDELDAFEELFEELLLLL